MGDSHYSSPERGGGPPQAVEGFVGPGRVSGTTPPAPPSALRAATSPSRGGDAVLHARALVGTRFRPHGRDPATGLDCVGLAGLAMGVAELPSGYALRGGTAEAVAAAIDAAGLLRCAARPGALGLAESGPGQWHLLVLTDTGLVHADAGRRRVVERPGPVPWPVWGWWCVPQSSPERGGGSPQG